MVLVLETRGGREGKAEQRVTLVVVGILGGSSTVTAAAAAIFLLLWKCDAYHSIYPQTKKFGTLVGFPILPSNSIDIYLIVFREKIKKEGHVVYIDLLSTTMRQSRTPIPTTWHVEELHSLIGHFPIFKIHIPLAYLLLLQFYVTYTLTGHSWVWPLLNPTQFN